MEAAKLGKKFDSFPTLRHPMKARKDAESEAIDLPKDTDQVLNPDWRNVFLSFMEISHLPPSRLMLHAQALLAEYPADPMSVDRRHPPTEVAFERWYKKMYTPADLTHRRRCEELFDSTRGLVCCLASTEIVQEQGRKRNLLGTLVVAFERRSGTLVHQIYRHEPTELDVLHVAQKLAAIAIERLGAAYEEPVFYLVLPGDTPRTPWSDQLRWLFEKNLPPGNRKPAKDSQDKTVRCPGGATVDEQQRLLRCKVYGRKFSTRYDIWMPVDYAPCYPLPTIVCDDHDGANDVHDLLAKAARSIRSALKKLASSDQITPTWEALSRSRVKQSPKEKSAATTTTCKLPEEKKPVAKKSRGSVSRLSPFRKKIEPPAE